MTENLNYSKLSVSLTKELNKEIKKNNGIYFTPPTTVSKNIEILEKYMENIKEVLEPSCGSCEYILKLCENYNDINITGIENNEEIFLKIKSLENKNIKLYNKDYLKYESDNKYDLIIGNPPYFVIKKKDINKSYYKYFDGRPNIFIIFIIKSLNLLNENGILSFVLPKNFLNCLYYNKTRKYINNNFEILDIIECNDNYIETQQETIIIVIKNTNNLEEKKNSIFCLDVGEYTIFGITENIIKLKSLYMNSTTLDKLDFNVCVGNVVWNQVKDELTNDEKKTLLVYSSDIKNKKLKVKKYSNNDKKNYINKKGSIDPILVMNRGYGVGKYNFEYCLINETECVEYLIENHLICIKYLNSINKEELIKLYKKIIKSFENKNTEDFIKLYFGNNAINTTELCNILPIYDI
jgi:adenine-specific DNA-methyltransferase